jgi:hypothetical protein
MIPVPGTLSLKLVIGIGCALLLALLIHDRNHWKAKTTHYAELLAAERGAHSATVAGYRVAAERARLADGNNSARVRAEQAAINERTVDDFQDRIAAARAAAGRMQPNPAAAADSGGSRAAPVPGLSAAPARAAQAAAEGGLPDSDTLIATEQAIQLDELIRWVRAQGRVEVNGR